MDVALLTIGDEVLMGHTLDTNAQRLGRTFTTLGHRILAHETVPDEPIAIGRAVTRLRARADLLVVTGGLGGTPDDITLDTIAALLGRSVRESPELLEAFARRYPPPGGVFPEATRRIARVIEGAELLDNPVGQAPGVYVADPNGADLLLLPGVPGELRAILAGAEARFAAADAVRARTLRVVGASESQLDEALRARGVAGVAFLPGPGWLDLRLPLGAGDALVEAVEAICGDGLIGDETAVLEAIVGAQLTEAGQTVATAESLSGGAVGARLTRVPGASAYFLGGVSAYANEVKHRVLGVDSALLDAAGAVSGEVARHMALGVKRITGADYGLSTTGIAGPTGATPGKPVGLVYVGLATPDGSALARVRRFPGDRAAVLSRTVTFALDLLRRALSGLSLPGEEA